MMFSSRGWMTSYQDVAAIAFTEQKLDYMTSKVLCTFCELTKKGNWKS